MKKAIRFQKCVVFCLQDYENSLWSFESVQVIIFMKQELVRSGMLDMIEKAELVKKEGSFVYTDT